MVNVIYKDLTSDEEVLRSMPISVGTFHRVKVGKPELPPDDDPMLGAALIIEAWLRAEAEKYAVKNQSPPGEE